MNIFARLTEPHIFEDMSEVIPTIRHSRKIKKSHFSVGMLEWIALKSQFDFMEPRTVDGEQRYYTLRSFYYNGEKYFIQYYMLKSEIDLIDMDKDRKFHFFVASSSNYNGFPPFNI